MLISIHFLKIVQTLFLLFSKLSKWAGCDMDKELITYWCDQFFLKTGTQTRIILITIPKKGWNFTNQNRPLKRVSSISLLHQFFHHHNSEDLYSLRGEANEKISERKIGFKLIKLKHWPTLLQLRSWNINGPLPVQKKRERLIMIFQKKFTWWLMIIDNRMSASRKKKCKINRKEYDRRNWEH